MDKSTVSFKIGKIRLNPVNICAVLLSYAAFVVLFAPYQPNNTMGNFTLRMTLRISLYVVAFTIFLIYLSIKHTFTLSVFVPLIYILLTNMHVYTYEKVSVGLLSFLLLTVFLMMDGQCQKQTYIYFRRCLVLLSLIGIIVYLSYIFDFPLPYETRDYYFSLGEWHKPQYIDYGLSFLYQENSIIRLCGIFNEPGLHGTVCGLVLCAEDLNVKSKGNWILFISGILTMSVAFFMLIFIYFILKYSRKPVYFFIVIFLLMIWIVVLPQIKTGNELLDNFIGRFVITKNGLAGDNRSNEELDLMIYEVLKEKPFWGYGGGYSNYRTSFISSYKMQIIEYGLFGFSLMYGAVFVSVVKKALKGTNLILFVLVFFISIYQRPVIFSLTYFVILYGGIAYRLNSSMDDHKKFKESEEYI